MCCEISQRRDRDLIVGMELEAGQSAERGDVLILFADRLAEDIDLDVRGLLCQRVAQ